MVWFSVPPYFPSNERCSFESVVRTMKRFEKVTLDLFKAGRKPVIGRRSNALKATGSMNVDLINTLAF
jgi:hypothetical protein